MPDPISNSGTPLRTVPESQTLEIDVPLSQSVIWRFQRDFYAQRGLKAWTEDMVPAYITNNPFLAEIYAEIVAAFLDDCMKEDRANPAQSVSPVSPENPLHILELGAGSRPVLFPLPQQAACAAGSQESPAADRPLFHVRLF